MHTLLMLSSIVLLIPGYVFAFWLLHRSNGWQWHRRMHLLLLAVPLVSLVMNLFAVEHFLSRPCFTSAPRWDILLSLVVACVMGLIALGSIGLGIVRQLLLTLFVAQRGKPVKTELQATVMLLAQKLAITPPRVLLCTISSPLALTYGILHPTVVLSSWMIEHLDQCELEAVLAHELAHITRRDTFIGWIALLLRDAFCYLPTSWQAYQQLRQEKEFASDDLAIALTQRPVGLASALAKVWQEALRLSRFCAGSSLVGMESTFEGRITRLLFPQTAVDGHFSPRWFSLRGVLLACTALMLVEGGTFIAFLATMGCSPLASLGKL